MFWNESCWKFDSEWHVSKQQHKFILFKISIKYHILKWKIQLKSDLSGKLKSLRFPNIMFIHNLWAWFTTCFIFSQFISILRTVKSILRKFRNSAHRLLHKKKNKRILCRKKNRTLWITQFSFHVTWCCL